LAFASGVCNRCLSLRHILWTRDLFFKTRSRKVLRQRPDNDGHEHTSLMLFLVVVTPVGGLGQKHPSLCLWTRPSTPSTAQPGSPLWPLWWKAAGETPSCISAVLMMSVSCHGTRVNPLPSATNPFGGAISYSHNNFAPGIHAHPSSLAIHFYQPQTKTIDT